MSAAREMLDELRQEDARTEWLALGAIERLASSRHPDALETEEIDCLIDWLMAHRQDRDMKHYAEGLPF